jgi:hypothetical protein
VKEAKPDEPPDGDQQSEIRRFRKEIHQLRLEREILKKPRPSSPSTANEISIHCRGRPTIEVNGCNAVKPSDGRIYDVEQETGDPIGLPKSGVVVQIGLGRYGNVNFGQSDSQHLDRNARTQIAARDGRAARWNRRALKSGLHVGSTQRERPATVARLDLRYLMPFLRLLAWNCRSGTLTARLAELTEHAVDIAFLQECSPAESLPLAGQVLACSVGPQKGIALVSLNVDYHLAELEPRGGKAVIAAAVTGPVAFTALGIWAQKPKYVHDVLRTLDAYADLLRSGPAVIMGDLNSGTDLSGERTPSKAHLRLVEALADLGLVSAYHAFHNIEQGQETHPTYRHQFQVSQPWHIDFCFLPASWANGLTRVDVIDGEEWIARSVHHPLRVELRIP